ncbi:hypothetical protein BCR36DRAFT_581385 [Piromyces finnis]|uniref:Uncharacterized protein n=1 Tax=Piromyces finnis TaxID=1754191 RepID=A0A1Y1VGZ5_9FUNG|nr:hypothetical protein BCR36DRAFT_581385 [Piromyces finnis]|eukprot:ORX55353.1 hypothetical protein BCR36DRAFT_581385 [Piromyces finnis]
MVKKTISNTTTTTTTTITNNNTNNINTTTTNNNNTITTTTTNNNTNNINTTTTANNNNTITTTTTTTNNNNNTNNNTTTTTTTTTNNNNNSINKEMKHKISSKILKLFRKEHKKSKKYSIERSNSVKSGNNKENESINETINDTQNDTCDSDSDIQECSKLTVQEFAKAVGINIFQENHDIKNHGIDIEEENNCSCEYCTCSYSKSFCCSSHNLFTGSNNFIVNSKTVDIPGYSCCHKRKKSTSRIIDMSFFINPLEQESKFKTNHPIEEIHARQRSASTCTSSSNLPSFENYNNYKAYCRQRSASISIVSMCHRNCSYNYSSSFQDSYVDANSFSSSCRCDSGIELYNTTNFNPNPNPNLITDSKKSYPSYNIIHSTTITNNVNNNSMSLPQYYNSSIKPKNQYNFPYQRKNSMQSDEYTNKSNSNHSRNTSLTSFSNSSIQSIKPHSKLKITKSIIINEGVRCSEINIKPIKKEEIKVYTKGRFIVTCKSSGKPDY